MKKILIKIVLFAMFFVILLGPNVYSATINLAYTYNSATNTLWIYPINSSTVQLNYSETYNFTINSLEISNVVNYNSISNSISPVSSNSVSSISTSYNSISIKSAMTPQILSVNKLQNATYGSNFKLSGLYSYSCSSSVHLCEFTTNNYTITTASKPVINYNSINLIQPLQTKSTYYGSNVIKNTNMNFEINITNYTITTPSKVNKNFIIGLNENSITNSTYNFTIKPPILINSSVIFNSIYSTKKGSFKITDNTSINYTINPIPKINIDKNLTLGQNYTNKTLNLSIFASTKIPANDLNESLLMEYYNSKISNNCISNVTIGSGNDIIDLCTETKNSGNYSLIDYCTSSELLSKNFSEGLGQCLINSIYQINSTNRELTSELNNTKTQLSKQTNLTISYENQLKQDNVAVQTGEDVAGAIFLVLAVIFIGAIYLEKKKKERVTRMG